MKGSVLGSRRRVRREEKDRADGCEGRTLVSPRTGERAPPERKGTEGTRNLTPPTLFPFEFTLLGVALAFIRYFERNSQHLSELE